MWRNTLKILYIILLFIYIYIYIYIAWQLAFWRKAVFLSCKFLPQAVSTRCTTSKKKDGYKWKEIYTKDNSQRTQFEISSVCVCVCVCVCVTALNLPSLCSECCRRFYLINFLASVRFPDSTRGCMHSNTHTHTQNTHTHTHKTMENTRV
jgi:hypothetical protein